MKKVFALAIALVLALSMVVFAAAEDAATVVSELIAAVGEEALVEAVNEELAALGVDATALAADELPASAGDSLAAAIIDRFSIDPDSDMGKMITDSASNEFVSFIAELYYDGKVIVDDPEPTTAVEISEEDPPETGTSPAVALTAFATITVAAAAAFVCLKKKED